MELSNELKVERIRLSLTAKSVAEEMGISRQQLCNIEQSETAPVVVKYIAFLRSKGVDLNALFDRKLAEADLIIYEENDKTTDLTPELVARALLPMEIYEGCILHYEMMQYSMK